MIRPAALMALAWLIGTMGPICLPARAAPPTRAERMAAEVSSQVAEFLWVKTDDYGHTGQPEKAKALMRMVIQLDPSLADAYSVLASYTPRTVERGQIYRAGLRANPESFQLNFEYGYFYHDVWSRNPTAGIPYLRTAVNVAPDAKQKVKALHVLGHLYRRSDQTRQAIATWQEVLRLNPTDQVARRELAQLRAGGSNP